MREMGLLLLAAALWGLVGCANGRDAEAGAPSPTPLGTRLPADIQSRAATLTWQEAWLGDGLDLFLTQVLAREASGEADAAQKYLCAAYLDLEAAGTANPQGRETAVLADPAARWGSLWWYALREQISDAGLRDLLLVLQTQRGSEPVSLADVRAATDDVLRSDMSVIFAPWDNAATIRDVAGLDPCAGG